MTSLQQRAELHRQIWQIANDVRGSVDGWDFKQYVLGALFYRFISENFVSYIEAGDDSIRYAELDDAIITDDIKLRSDIPVSLAESSYPSACFIIHYRSVVSFQFMKVGPRYAIKRKTP